MKASELMNVLDEQDRSNGVWLFTPSMLQVLFPHESPDSMTRSLRRHVRAGILVQVKKALYANERATCVPGDKLPALVPYLKPNDINYVSQESRLSQLGVISQMPLSYLTLMTTGRSQVFETCYGTCQFTHTEKSIGFITKHTTLDPETGLLLADEELALMDLSRSRRNLDLVEEQREKNKLAESSGTKPKKRIKMRL